MAHVGRLKRICKDGCISMTSRGRCSTRDIWVRHVWRSGSRFLENGCIWEHQIFRFAKLILRDLNVALHDLPHFRVSSKHVAGSISEVVMRFDFNVVPLSKQIWPKTWLLNFWAATGVLSLLNESCGTEPGNWTHWEEFAGSLKWNELPQQHRASSNTSL